MNKKQNNYLITSIDELESFRAKTFYKIIMIIILIVGLIFILSLLIGSFDFIFASIILGIFLSSILTHKDRRKYKISYKNLVVLDVFKKRFNNVKYIPEYGFDSSVIRNTNMIRMGNRYSSNDYLSATYKNINFEAADVTIQDESTDSEGNTHTTTLFKGQWYIFDFNKSFKSNIEICERGFMNNKTGGLFSSIRLHKIEMEDIYFNKNFRVFAENDLEAFYILTPNMIERIKLLQKKIRGSIILCFVNNKLHLGVHNHKDFFEPSIIKPINVAKDEQEIMNSTNDIINFIDDLQLDKDLFRREV